MKKVFLWTNSDLDGVGTAVLLGNMFPEFDYKACFFGDFERQWDEWYEDNFSEYDKIFVVGMVLDQKLINKLDDYPVIFVSDRGDKFNVFDSTIINEECTSCTKLLYKRFKDKVEFPTKLKKFFAYIDDYNSYELKTEEAKYINAIYRKTWGGKFDKFVKRFWNGFDGFTESEITRADQFFDDLQKELETLDLYKGKFKDYEVISTFSKFSANEIAGELMKTYKADAYIIINPDTKFVSFRKSKGSEVDIAYMSEYLCDGGGGEWASGGQLTEKFLKFSEKLVEI